MICANDDCSNEFEKITYNQKYCSDFCCKEATTAKIRKKYLEKKERLSGKKRICSTRGCNTVLVKYNEGSVCEYCISKKRKKELSELLSMVGYVNK